MLQSIMYNYIYCHELEYRNTLFMVCEKEYKATSDWTWDCNEKLQRFAMKMNSSIAME